MKKNTVIVFLILMFSNATFIFSQKKAISDSLFFNGQLSVYANYNQNNSLPLFVGGRYIPTLHYNIKLPNEKLIDFEVSANILGTFASNPFDTSHVDKNISAYRAWARYSTSQLEIRIGLQKINFGSASMLRPLMWFDQIDPRDPLKLTNGVWGLLGRYYFLNNANIWLWCLYGNDKQRSWDIGATNKNIPELGGRFQFPITKGELGLSYHHRKVDTRGYGENVPAFSQIPENRIGIDGKWDLGVGLWFENTWTNKSKNIGVLTNQEIQNIGIDNNFDIGNGLNLIFEQLFVSTGERAFYFTNNILFSALSLSYPLSLVDNINAIVYFDEDNKTAYNFVNWNHQFKNITFYLMAYWNPKTYLLPQQGDAGNLFSGQGLQIMFVYNH